jgi:hypothetical protein
MPKTERIFRKKFTLTIGAAETTKTEAFVLEGEISALFVRMPNWTNVVTGVVSILDQDGYEVVVSTALARNADHKVAAAWPLPGSQTLKVVLGGVPGGAGGDVIVVAYGRALG